MINLVFKHGGCSCAGTYTLLLHVDQETSHHLIDEISLEIWLETRLLECRYIQQPQQKKLKWFDSMKVSDR
jgi:hypothetical protein